MKMIDSFNIYRDFFKFVDNNFVINDNELTKIPVSTLSMRTNPPRLKDNGVNYNYHLMSIQSALSDFYRKAAGEEKNNGEEAYFSKFWRPASVSGSLHVYKEGNVYLMTVRRPTDEEIKLVNKANEVIKQYVPKFDTKICIIPGILENNAKHANRGDVSFLLGGKREGKELFTNTDDVLYHEVGHFILNELNPKFKTDKSPSAKVVHESFADTVAFLEAANDKSNREKLDLKKLYYENPISRIGENKDDGERTIRGLYATTEYAPAEDPHYASRPITEALYRGWAYLVQEAIKQGKTRDQAIDHANAVIKDIIINAAKNTDTYVESYVKEIINSTKDEKLKEVLISEFSSRKLYKGNKENK
jgi:uncharacterized protein YozE (UPF0346 family)